jgi:hypothetical protein
LPQRVKLRFIDFSKNHRKLARVAPARNAERFKHQKISAVRLVVESDDDRLETERRTCYPLLQKPVNRTAEADPVKNINKVNMEINAFISTPEIPI